VLPQSKIFVKTASGVRFMFVGSLHETPLELSFRLEAEVSALSEVEWAAMEKSPLERALPYPRRTCSDGTEAQGRPVRSAPKKISPRRCALVEMTQFLAPAVANLPTNMKCTRIRLTAKESLSTPAIHATIVFEIAGHLLSERGSGRAAWNGPDH
jgi:hypothetical protein